jgi:hypothetical protein
MKPLGIKNYGSIGHLPNSRIGPGDHHVHAGQAVICTEKTRDKHDIVIVTEKLDGSNVGVARIGDKILALGRAGYLAQTSKFEQHQLFADWVRKNEARFLEVLVDGERMVGEWLALAHGTRYQLNHEPLVVFDLMRGHQRAPWNELSARLCGKFVLPRLISIGPPISVESVLDCLEPSGHGAIDPVEGAVWRVERRGEFEFMAKYVRPEKVDGCYLTAVSGQPDVWNWRPEKS